VKVLKFLSIAIFMIVVSGVVLGDTIDFTKVSPDTAVTSQYPGVVFSLAGGNNPNVNGAPTTDKWGYGLLTNTTDGGIYPTAEFLVATFTTPVTLNSFTFFNGGFNGNNNYQLFNSTGGLITSGLMNGVWGSDITNDFITYDFGVNCVSKIIWDNGMSPWPGDSWWDGVENLSFNQSVATQSVATTPEPGTLVMFGTGILGLAGAARRRFCL
jgi:hypothetical protein